MRGVTGYTYGLFDLFHVGHLAALRQAKEHCDRLIVGVLSDEEAERSWGVRPFMPLIERLAIVESARLVDGVIPRDTRDIVAAHTAVGFDVVFAAPPHTGHAPATDLKRHLEGTGVQIVALDEIPLPSGPVLRGALLNHHSVRSSVA